MKYFLSFFALLCGLCCAPRLYAQLALDTPEHLALQQTRAAVLHPTPDDSTRWAMLYEAFRLDTVKFTSWFACSFGKGGGWRRFDRYNLDFYTDTIAYRPDSVPPNAGIYVPVLYYGRVFRYEEQHRTSFLDLRFYKLKWRTHPDWAADTAAAKPDTVAASPADSNQACNLQGDSCTVHGHQCPEQGIIFHSQANRLNTGTITLRCGFGAERDSSHAPAEAPRTAAANRATPPADFRAFPNPTREVLQLSWQPLPEVRRYRVSLMDLAGQQVFSRATDATTGRATLQLSHLPAGLYTLRLQNHQGKPLLQEKIILNE